MCIYVCTRLYMCMYVYVRGLSTENRLRSQRTKTPYEIKVNNCYLINLMIRIKLTSSSNLNDMILKFSYKFDHLFSHVFIFGNMFPESHGFLPMPVTSCIKDIYPNLSLSN